MKKQMLKLNGVEALDKTQQKGVKGGAGGTRQICYCLPNATPNERTYCYGRCSHHNMPGN